MQLPSGDLNYDQNFNYLLIITPLPFASSEVVVAIIVFPGSRQ